MNVGCLFENLVITHDTQAVNYYHKVGDSPTDIFHFNSPVI
jgi:hypothetical protein